MKPFGKILCACLILAAFGCQRHSEDRPLQSSVPTQATAKSAPTAKGNRISRDTGRDLVMKVPEVKEWSIAVEKAGRKVTCCLADGNDTVEAKDGYEYWPITLYEDTGKMLNRWVTFMVRVDGKSILVENDIDPENSPLTLEQWRIQEKELRTEYDKDQQKR